MSARVVLFLTALLAAAAILVVAGSSGDSDYVVRAEFANANGLQTNSRVTVAGQPVGRVRDLELTSDDRVRATIVLDPDAGPVGGGATAKIRPANLLGEKYVDLNVGRASSQPLPSETTIPVSRTGSPVELDDVVSVLDAPTRAGLSALLNESGIALTGRGDDFARTLRSLPPSLDRVGELLSQLTTDNAALGRLIDTSDRVVARIARRRQPLGRLVKSANTALATTAERDRELARLVQESPATLAQLRSSLARLDDAAAPLGAASDQLTISAPALERLLEQIEPFADAAEPTLRTATRVAPDLTRLGADASPAVRRLRPVIGDLRDFAGALDGVTTGLQQGLPDTLGAAEGWARAIQGRDGAGHLFRNDAGITSDTLKSLLSTLSRDDGPVKKAGPADKRPGKPDSAPTRTPKPSLPSLLPTPAKPLPKLPPAIDDLLDPITKTITEALGLPGGSDKDKAAPNILDSLLRP